MRDACTAPVPMDYPTPTAQLDYAIIGEAPGPDEDHQGRPFVGKSGKLLRDLMAGVGLDEDKAAWMNAVSCYPHTSELRVRGDRPRAPSDTEMSACRRNLMTQLEAANVEYVLLVGGTALRVWRPDLKISDVAGRVGLWMDRWVVMPVLHPSYVLRQGKPSKLRLAEDLFKFRLVVAGELDWDQWLAVDCTAAGCVGGMARMDRDGLAWCAKHWMARQGGAGRKAWKDARDRWGMKADRGLAARMELDQ